MPLVRADPHLPERAQAREDAAADPAGVLALGRRGDADLGVLDREGAQLREQAVAEALGQRGAAGEDDVGEEGGAQVEVAARDAARDERGDARVLVAEEGGVEEEFRGPEARGRDLLCASA